MQADFGSLFQFIRNGMNVKQDKSGDGFPITRIETISDATVDPSRVGYAGLTEADSRDWFLQAGDILFSHINSVDHIGKCAVYRGTPAKLVHGMNLLCLRSNPTKLLPEFAKYLMRGSEFRTRLSNFINKAVNQASVSIGNLKTIPVTVPPLAEQQRIAEVLDRAEALRAKRRAALAQLDSLTQSLFLDLFGDPRANEKGWPHTAISSVVSDMRGGAALEPDDFVESGFPILHKGAIKPDGGLIIDPKKKTFAPVEFANANRRCQANREFTAVTLRDLVPSGPSIGLAVDLRNGRYDEYLLAQGAYAFRLKPDKVLPEFFVHLSNAPNFRHVLRQNAVGSTQIHIRTPVYLAILIPLPPLDLQREFARRVAAVEKLKAAQRAALAELDALFAVLQHRAFRGEL